MAWVFANLIKNKKQTIDDVPDTLLTKVKALLDQWGVEYNVQR